MLTLTSGHDTGLHRLPVAPKLAGLCLFTVALFATDSPLVLTLALGLVLAGWLSGGAGFARDGLRLMRPLWSFVAILIAWHLWTGDWRGGVVILLRMLAAVAAANLVTMTSRLSDMLAVFERLLSPLARLGLPPRVPALAVALVIRFIPVMVERQTRIAEAWRARSPRRPGWRVLVPALIGALDDADHVAEALRARGGAG